MLYNIVRKTKQKNLISNQKSAHRNTKKTFQTPTMSRVVPIQRYCLAAARTQISADIAQIPAESMQYSDGSPYSRKSAQRNASSSCMAETGTNVHIQLRLDGYRTERDEAAQNAGSIHENKNQTGRNIPHGKSGITVGKNSAFQPSNTERRTPGKIARTVQNRKSGIDKDPVS